MRFSPKLVWCKQGLNVGGWPFFVPLPSYYKLSALTAVVVTDVQVGDLVKSLHTKISRISTRFVRNNTLHRPR